MKLDDFLKNKNFSLQQATLCFLLRENEVLLGMKKRGFAAGKWNGFGGKPEEGENITKAARREVQEEAKLTPKSLIQVAEIDFYHLRPEKSWNQQVIVYLTEEWEGAPKETEEMRPKWFSIDEIPYDSMWADDKHWLPHILERKKLKGKFLFDEEENILDKEIKLLKTLE